MNEFLPQLIQQLFNGLSLGAIYALIAIGYTMVYGIAKMLNFAHGDVIMVGAYALFVSITQLELPIPVTFLLCVIISATLGFVVEKLAYKPLRKATPMT